MLLERSSLPWFATIWLLLCSNVSSWSHTSSVPNVYLPELCPPTVSETYLAVTNTIIPAPIDQVWDYIGDFFDITWQNLTVLATTGADNKAGATRTFSYGFNVTETLLQYVDTPQVKYYEYGYSIDGSAPATIGGVLYTKLFNLMKITSITTSAEAGKTSFEYTQRGCADNGEAGIAFWEEIHDADLNAVVEHFA